MKAMYLIIRKGYHIPISEHLVRGRNFAGKFVFNIILFSFCTTQLYLSSKLSVLWFFGGSCVLDFVCTFCIYVHPSTLVFRFCLYFWIYVFMYTLPPFLPWPLIPFVRLADRAPGTQITLRVSSQILRYTNIYNICPPGEFLVISSRICGEYLPQIFVPTGSLITITDKENVHKNVNNWNTPSSINYFGGYMHFLHLDIALMYSM